MGFIIIKRADVRRFSEACRKNRIPTARKLMRENPECLWYKTKNGRINRYQVADFSNNSMLIIV
jgi:hypothetical protein